MVSRLIHARLTRALMIAIVLSTLALPFTSLRASAALERIVASSSVTGGRNITIRIDLDRPAYAGGFIVLLYSTSSLIPIPGFVLVPAGADSVSLTVKTGTTTVDTAVTISAASGATKAYKTITVKKPYLYKFVVQPTYLEGANGYITAKISGPAPSGGVTIYFNSNRPSKLAVPASAKIPAGSTSVTVAVTPVMVPYDIAVNLSASSSGIKITWPTIVKNGA